MMINVKGKQHAMKTYWGHESKATCILHHFTRWNGLHSIHLFP